MESHKSFGGRNGSLCCFFLGIFLLFSYTDAEDGVIKQVPDPTGNVNLSPFQQSRSAYECLQNTSDSCPDKYKLTEVGWVNVTQSDTIEYCKPDGCAQHTMVVLTCIDLVKHDYTFGDKSSVHELNNTITTGCSSGFTGTKLKTSNARKVYERNVVPFVAVWFVITHFNSADEPVLNEITNSMLTEFVSKGVRWHLITNVSTKLAT